MPSPHIMVEITWIVDKSRFAHSQDVKCET